MWIAYFRLRQVATTRTRARAARRATGRGAPFPAPSHDDAVRCLEPSDTAGRGRPRPREAGSQLVLVGGRRSW